VYKEKDIQQQQHPYKPATKSFISSEKRRLQGTFSAIIWTSF